MRIVLLSRELSSHVPRPPPPMCCQAGFGELLDCKWDHTRSQHYRALATRARCWLDQLNNKYQMEKAKQAADVEKEIARQRALEVQSQREMLAKKERDAQEAKEKKARETDPKASLKAAQKDAEEKGKLIEEMMAKFAVDLEEAKAENRARRAAATAAREAEPMNGTPKHDKSKKNKKSEKDSAKDKKDKKDKKDSKVSQDNLQRAELAAGSGHGGASAAREPPEAVLEPDLQGHGSAELPAPALGPPEAKKSAHVHDKDGDTTPKDDDMENENENDESDDDDGDNGNHDGDHGGDHDGDHGGDHDGLTEPDTAMTAEGEGL